MKTLSIIVLLLVNISVGSTSVASTSVAPTSVAPTIIYKKTNSDGTVSYSDQQSEGAVQIDHSINNTAVMPSVSPPNKPVYTSTNNKKTLNAEAIYTLTIVSPGAEQTVRNNLGDVDVVATISPKAKGTFQLLLNGELKSTQPSPVFHLKDLQRGEHSIQIRFVGKSGKILALTETQIFFLHKASVFINAN